MYDAEVAGERALICSVINKAISDAFLYKRPRPPHKRGFKIDKLKNISSKFLMCLKVLDDPDKYTSSTINMCRKHIIKINRKSFLKFTSRAEEYCFEARQFLSSKNELFRFYCQLVDIDPISLEERVNKRIKAFDHGKKYFKHKKR